MNVAILLLAAGSSSRLGESKQLLDIHGQTLLEHSAKIALGSLAKKVIVVLGSEKEKHQEALKNLPVEIVHNPDWKKGMGNSLKAGIKKISTDKTFDAVIVMVCDQPLLTSDHLNHLILDFTTHHRDLIASRYAGTFGVPALFGKKYFHELENLGDEEGAKKILARHSEHLHRIDFPEGEIDLDTKKDYLHFRNQFKSGS